MLEYIFYIFAAMLVLAALRVVTAANPVHAVLFLIFAFFNTSALFILLGAEYIAMTLVIVYVGAVAVLFLFVVMMLDIDSSTVKLATRKHLPLVLLMSALICAQIITAVYVSMDAIPVPSQGEEAVGNTLWIGQYLYTDYILPFQLAGLILLVAMIGAIMLTLRHSKKVKRQDIPKQISRTREESIRLVKVKTGEGVAS